jgi:hypothetical protein
LPTLFFIKVVLASIEPLHFPKNFEINFQFEHPEGWGCGRAFAYHGQGTAFDP